MFTGIIEDLGKITSIEKEDSNLHFCIESKISPELKIDQSIAHNGVCLTVIELNQKEYVVTAIKETLDISSLSNLKEGDVINLERSMSQNGRLDGHIVQGHVDGLATCKAIEDLNGSWKFTFQIDPQNAHLLVDKGSVCINGVSLTVCDLTQSSFSVNIIPYTYENTNFKALSLEETVNIEFDILGKYVSRYLSLTAK